MSDEIKKIRKEHINTLINEYNICRFLIVLSFVLKKIPGRVHLMINYLPWPAGYYFLRSTFRNTYLRTTVRGAVVFAIIVATIYAPVFPQLSQYLPQQLSNVLPKVEQARADISDGSDTWVIITVASSSPWTVPPDWNSASNSVQVFGGGGAGADGSNAQGVGGGGGGGYSKITNLSLTPGNTVTFNVGAGGTSPVALGTGGAGGHTWFGAATYAACASAGPTACVSAEGGEGGRGVDDGRAGGPGGGTASASGTIKYSGGTGGAGTINDGNGGGGGAAGPHASDGNGEVGGTSSSTGGSGGGGGGGGSATVGVNATGTTGTNGGHGYGGTGGGIGNAPGGDGTAPGAGGGGGDAGNNNAGSGATGAQLLGLFGSGGGGGGGGDHNNSVGGRGALYGGGGGAGGACIANCIGAAGVIVVKYTPISFTIIGTNGASPDPAADTMAPGEAAQVAGRFSFRTSGGTTDITSITVTASTSGTAFNGVSYARITNVGGGTVYQTIASGSMSNDTWVFNSLTAFPTITTTSQSFEIRIKPKNHLDMPAVPGDQYALQARVTAWTDGVNQIDSGSDTNPNKLTIDNKSPSNVTNFTAASGNAKVNLAWTDPSDATGGNILILRRSGSAVALTPTEGVTYTEGQDLGSSTIVAAFDTIASTSTEADLGLINGTDYYYKIFVQDASGNYSQTGATADNYPVTPAEPTYDQSGYRVYETKLTSVGSSFGTDGTIAQVGSNFNVAGAIYVDGDYVYVAGSDNTTDWRIDKYNKSNGGICDDTTDCPAGVFGTAGTIAQPGTSFNVANAIFVDADYVYVAGSDNASDWRIDKYNKSNGGICDDTTDCPAGVFGTAGTIAQAGTSNNIANAIFVDGDYVYVAGSDNSSDWRIDKYNKNNGGICDDTTDCPAGVFGTAGTIAQAGTNSNVANAIFVDADYVYVAGYDNNSDWRIDKYNKNTGAICSTGNCVSGVFGTAGTIAQAGTNGNFANAIYVDGDYVYVAGDDNDSNDWRIDKYNKNTGAICSTGNCVAGVFGTAGTIAQTGTNANIARSIYVDGDYVYVAGDDNTSGDWRIDKYNKNTGAICSTGNCVAGVFGTAGTIAQTGTNANKAYAIYVDGDYVYVAGDDNDSNDWRIDKYNNETGNLCTGLNCIDVQKFNEDGTIVQAGTSGNQTNAIAVDGDYVYVAGYDNDGDWRIDKYNKNNGGICDDTTDCPAGIFGTAGTIVQTGTGFNQANAIFVDADYVYVAGSDNSSDWRIDKYNKNNGGICDDTTDCPAGVFGTAGTIAQTGTNANIARAIAVDADYVYVAGDDNTSGDWRIDKYNKNNGGICDDTTDCPAGVFGTAGTIAQTGTNSNIANAIFVDRDYVYVAGSDSVSGSTDWRIDKYNKNTGSICSTGNCVAGVFGTAGTIAQAGTNANIARSIYVDADYAYVAGIDNSNSDWRIDKYDNETGELADSDSGSINIGPPLAAVNTVATLTETNQKFRIRALIHVGTAQLDLTDSTSSPSFSLQYSEKVGTCDSAFSGESYLNITTTSPIAWDRTASSDGVAFLASPSIDPFHDDGGRHATVSQTYEELNNFRNSIAAIPAGSDGMWEFALKDNNAPTGASYCLRIIESDGTVLSGYSNIANVTISATITPFTPTRPGGGDGPSFGGGSGGSTPLTGGNQSGGGAGSGGGEGGGAPQGGGGPGGGGGGSPIIFWWWIGG